MELKTSIKTTITLQNSRTNIKGTTNRITKTSTTAIIIIKNRTTKNTIMKKYDEESFEFLAKAGGGVEVGHQDIEVPGRGEGVVE